MGNIKFIKALDKINKNLNEILLNKDNTPYIKTEDPNMNLFESINVTLESENKYLEQQLAKHKELLNEVIHELAELSQAVKRLK